MEEIERLLATISITSFEMDPIHLVEVTHVIDPLDFYVRPMKYRPIIQLIERMEPQNHLPNFNVNDLVVFHIPFLHGSRKFVRGRITHLSQVESFLFCDIFAIDYGFLEKLVPIKYMWECSIHLVNIPPLACNCQLANCYPLDLDSFSSDSIEFFKSYAGNKPFHIKVMGKKFDKILVELINSALESIGRLLAMQGHVRLGHLWDAVAWLPVTNGRTISFKLKDLSVGETLKVIVKSGDSLNGFNVVEVNDYKKHLEEIGDITFNAKKEFYLSPLHFIAELLVCVEIIPNSIYERAFIKKVTIPFKKAIVQLVDWGTTAEYDIEKMKYMPLKCLKSPVFTIYCKSDESQVWDNGLDRFLTPGFQFYITIKSLGNDFDCPNIVDISPLEFGDEPFSDYEVLPSPAYPV